MAADTPPDHAVVPQQADHAVIPQAGTVYSWHSMPADERDSSDYPLSCCCDVCGVFADRASPGDPWLHRAPGAGRPDVMAADAVA